MRIIKQFLLFTVGIITFAFFSFRLNPIAASVIATFVILTFRTLMLILKRKRLNNILENEFNPLGFIEANKKNKEFSRTTNYHNLCNVNIAVGFIELREYKKAFSFLKLVQLPVKKYFETYYHLALMNCYIGLSDLENAKFEYENFMQKPRGKYSDSCINFAIDSAVIKYNYLLQKSPETAKYYLDMMYYQQKAYDKMITKRQKLYLLYNIATLEEELGDIENAVKNYKIVSESGNLLWIATASTNKLNELHIAVNP